MASRNASKRSFYQRGFTDENGEYHFSKCGNLEIGQTLVMGGRRGYITKLGFIWVEVCWYSKGEGPVIKQRRFHWTQVHEALDGGVHW